MKVEAASDNTMSANIAGELLNAVEKPLLVALEKTAANTCEATFNAAGQRSTSVGRCEIVRECDAIDINYFQEWVYFKVARLTLVAANDPQPFRIILRDAIRAMLMVAQQKDLARLPSGLMVIAQSLLLDLHWLAQARERFIAGV